MRFWIIATIIILSGCAFSQRDLSVEEEVYREEQLRRLLSESVVALRQGTSEGNDSALAALELARELAPDDARVMDGLGSVEWRRGNYETAKVFFQSAISANPKYDRPYAHLAFVAERDGDLPAAYELLQRAIALNPMNYRARNNLAALYLEQKGPSDQASLELLKTYHSVPAPDEVWSYNRRRIR